TGSGGCVTTPGFARWGSRGGSGMEGINHPARLSVSTVESRGGDATPAVPKPGTAGPIRRRTGWEVRYQRTLLVADLLVGLVAGLLAFAIRFGQGGVTAYNQIYLLASVLFPVTLVVMLAANRAYERR